MERVSLNGMEVFPFTSVEQLFRHIDCHKGILVAVNAEKVTTATDETRTIVNSNVGYADGAGVVVALHKKGYPNAVRIAGCDLWLDILRLSGHEKSVYLVGGTQEVIENTVEKLREEFPQINIVGYRNGYINDNDERAALIDDVVCKAPDIIFVAMGSPRQEFLMAEMLARHPAIYQGLGGSFDVYTGRVKRAPKWWCEHKLEFLYRLIKQPSRIKRQKHLVKYAYWLITNKL